MVEDDDATGAVEETREEDAVGPEAALVCAFGVGCGTACVLKVSKADEKVLHERGCSGVDIIFGRRIGCRWLLVRWLVIGWLVLLVLMVQVVVIRDDWLLVSLTMIPIGWRSMVTSNWWSVTVTWNRWSVVWRRAKIVV